MTCSRRRLNANVDALDEIEIGTLERNGQVSIVRRRPDAS
jgi:uncharacterized membrane protein YcaP (DUF421 family)